MKTDSLRHDSGVEVTNYQSHSGNIDDLSDQPPEDILQHGADEKQCISGKIKLTWPHKDINKIEVLVAIPSHDRNACFRIVFQLEETYFQTLDLLPGDEFRLSLQGVKVQKLSKIPKLSNLPMQLLFSGGVHVRWKHQGPKEPEKTLNTLLFSSSENDTKITDSWFFSQEVKIKQAPRLKRNRIDVEEPQGNILSARGPKKQQRLDAKRQKREANAPKSLLNHLLHTTNSSAMQRVSPTDKENGTSTHPSRDTLALDNQALSATQSIASHGSLSTPDFTTLNEIRLKQVTTLIGVVVMTSDPKLTRMGDWMRFVHLVDPSNCSPYSSGLKINCFSKRHKEWLPHPEQGDVLILRNVKIVDYQGGLAGVGYADKLQWAAFSPAKGEIHHGPPNSAPKKEGLAEGGFGVSFTPFLHPESSHTMHCVKLSDWWRNMNTEDSTKDTKYKVTANHQRVHRLISETGPSVPPDGYFDCTVLKGYSNSHSHNMVYTLYVTDYTRNEQMMGVQSNWCPPSLSDLVIQFEMWDEVATVAERMRPGQYYSIKNARMVTNSRGYPEGKVRENKIVQLDEEDVSNHQLQALLERKRQWESKQRTSELDITYLLIQDVQAGKFFNCTVELLRVVSKANQRPYIYVTDYTSHPRLANITEPGLQALQGRVVKIFVSDEHEHVVKSAAIGSYYCIKKLRLKQSTIGDCFCGFLGGNEKLIVQLNPNRTDNEHLNGLLRRKEAWQRNEGQNQPEQRAPNSAYIINDKKTSREPRRNIESFMRISDIISIDHHSERYLICASPIDFYPLELRDAFYQRCSRCNLDIPKTAKACFKCFDFEHEHVQYCYQLFVLLKDQEENELIISIDDKCSLFNGLKRTCIQEDRTAFDQFRERVEPILGNLILMHNGLKCGKRIEVNTSQYCFALESWLISGDRKAFRLTEIAPLD